MSHVRFVGDMYKTRFARLCDVPAILEVLGKHGGSSNLKVRTQADIVSQIESGYAIVRAAASNEDMVVAYAEIAALDQEQGIKALLRDNFQWSGYRFQAGDLFLYVAGLASIPNTVKGWGRFVVDFVEGNYFPTERKIRTLWAEDPSGGCTTRPRRIVFACGSTHQGAGLKLLVHYCSRHVLGGNAGPTHTEHIHHVMNDGTDRPGTLHLCYIDRPLSFLQRERTSRNRFLITEKEQQRLLSTRIGIVGLSTGSVALEALLREGIGGIYRLADFDIFEASNSNRMLFGLQDVGRSKIALCRERIQLVDPTLQIEEFPTGLTPDNVYAFVDNCDLIIEECDDFPVKLLVREAARSAKIPLVMATSQNGMIDVERYDCDPHCQPFLRIKPPLDVHKLQAMPQDVDKQDLAKAAQSLYDMRQISHRMLVSASEMGRSVSSFPQLAEEVFLNAASLAHVSRRILLGDKSVVSGRFSIRLDGLFTAHNRIPTETPVLDPSTGLAPHPRPDFSLEPSLGDHIKKLLFVMYWARSAPSGGNSQPWDTVLKVPSCKEAPCIDIAFRRGADCSKLIQPWNELALGCLLENAEIAAAELGVGVEIGLIETDPKAPLATRIALVRTKIPGKEVERRRRLFRAMSIRSSVRTTKPWTGPLPEKLEKELQSLGVQVVGDSHRASLIRQALLRERADRMSSRKERETLLSEIGAESCKIHPMLLGLSEDDKKALKIMKESPEAIDFMLEQGLQASLLRNFEEEVERIPLFLVLCDPTAGAGNIERGRLLERVWLTIVEHGIAARPSSLIRPSNLESIHVPNAFFILVPVEPCSLGLCSSRL